MATLQIARRLNAVRDRFADALERQQAVDARFEHQSRRGTVGLDFVGCLGPKILTFATDVAAQPVGWNPYHEPHAILAGKSGAGKTVAERFWLANLFKAGAEVWGVDPKGDFVIYEDVMSVAREQHEITNLLTAANDRAKDRQAEVSRWNAIARDAGEGATFYETYGQTPDAAPPMYVFLEEAAAIIGKGSGYDQRVRAEWFSQLWDLTQRGRSADVHLVYVVQLGTLISFGGDNGNGIRSSAAARVSFDRNPENLKAMFDASAPATLEVLKRLEQGGKGRVAYSYLDADSSAEVRAAQVAYITHAQMMRFVRNYSGPEPTNFNQ